MTTLTQTTRRIKEPPGNAPSSPGSALSQWALKDAKARFSELVRRVRSHGPQTVSVHGRDEVVVISAQDYRRQHGAVTGQALVDALASAPLRKVQLEPSRTKMPVRGVRL